jgi:hypothetical protein
MITITNYNYIFTDIYGLLVCFCVVRPSILHRTYLLHMILHVCLLVGWYLCDPLSESPSINLPIIPYLSLWHLGFSGQH